VLNISHNTAAWLYGLRQLLLTVAAVGMWRTVMVVLSMSVLKIKPITCAVSWDYVCRSQSTTGPCSL